MTVFGPPESSLNMFAVSTPLFTPVASATDIFTLSGSASKVIKIWHVEGFSKSGAQDNSNYLELFKRTVANTGGTSTANTVASFDSANTPTATSLYYTANPSGLGAGVRLLKKLFGIETSEVAAYPNANYNTNPDNRVIFSASKFKGPIVLRGVAQSIAISLNGVSFTGTSVGFNVFFSEE